MSGAGEDEPAPMAREPGPPMGACAVDGALLRVGRAPGGPRATIADRRRAAGAGRRNRAFGSRVKA